MTVPCPCRAVPCRRAVPMPRRAVLRRILGTQPHRDCRQQCDAGRRHRRDAAVRRMPLCAGIAATIRCVQVRPAIPTPSFRPRITLVPPSCLFELRSRADRAPSPTYTDRSRTSAMHACIPLDALAAGMVTSQTSPGGKSKLAIFA